MSRRIALALATIQLVTAMEAAVSDDYARGSFFLLGCYITVLHARELDR